jgi:EpsI family protein
VNRRRTATVLLLLVLTGGLATAARMPTPPRHSRLDSLPLAIGDWTGQDLEHVDGETLTVLGADAYLNRSYSDRSSTPVGLYVAYYARQSPGVSVHSPLHCLPGTGWETTDVATIALGAGDARRMIVRKNGERAVVLYWYAIHGRVLASELTSKAWLLHDSIRLRRSDAALIRIGVPIRSDDSTEAAERRALAFAQDALPSLSNLWSEG